MAVTPYFIAEAGVNHGGSFDEALRLIDAAKEARADAVKFQLFDYKLLKRPALQPLQLGRNAISDLKDYAAFKLIDFLCTPFDPGAVEFLKELGVKKLKLGSGAIFDTALRRAASDTGLPIIMSTGMATLEEVGVALLGLGDVTLLHCTSAYPTPLDAVNLRAMDTLAVTFNRAVGYSDHTANADVLVAAAVLGAEVIEAHITRDRTQSGPDHWASYEPLALKHAIQRIRQVGLYLGSGEKVPQQCEQPARKVWAA